MYYTVIATAVYVPQSMRIGEKMVSNNICKGCDIRIAIGIIIMVLLLINSANARTITVDDSGGADYTKIQDAVNAANAGDTILVYSGLYFENVVVNKQLELRGLETGSGMPVVNALGTASAIKITASGVILDGFNAKNGASYNGIEVQSSDNVITNNNASNNENGIVLYSTSNNTLSDNNVSDNSYGLQLSSSNNNILSKNNANSKDWGEGIRLYSSNNNTLSENTANSKNYGYGIFLYSSSNNTLSGNNASSSDYGNGISLYSSSNNTLIGNIASNHHLSLYYGKGISLDSSSNNNTLIGNTVNSNGHGIDLSYSHKNTLNGNIVNSNNYGIYLFSSIQNNVYDNFFNNTNNAYNDAPNKWNTTKTSGTNIIGGSYLGGNVWATPDGTGFSQTCPDDNDDGICDLQYELDTYNIDYLPLYYKVEITPPSSITNLTNTTYAQTYINWTWIDPTDEDFDKVMIYLNGTFKSYVPKGIQYFNATELEPTTMYEVGTRTVDSHGNINSTWVNHTSITAPLPPTVSISTDHYKYSPGDIMTVTLNINNPTSDPVRFEWYIGIPQANIWVRLASITIPTGYDETHTIPIPVGNWGSKPVGFVQYIHLLNSKGEVLAQDTATFSYSPSISPMSDVNTVKEIKKSIENVDFP